MEGAPQVGSTTKIVNKQRSVAKGVTALIEMEAREPGDVVRFAKACLEPSYDATIGVGVLYNPYCAWCAREGLVALTEKKFGRVFRKACESSGFTVEGDKVQCLSLKDAA